MLFKVNKLSIIVLIWQIFKYDGWKYKHRGRSVASYGRWVKDTAMRSQIVVTDDDDGIMYHSLPKQKPQSNKLVHSLKDSIEKNRQNAKKH